MRVLTLTHRSWAQNPQWRQPWEKIIKIVAPMGGLTCSAEREPFPLRRPSRELIWNKSTWRQTQQTMLQLWGLIMLQWAQHFCDICPLFPSETQYSYLVWFIYACSAIVRGEKNMQQKEHGSWFGFQTQENFIRILSASFKMVLEQIQLYSRQI